MTRDASAARAVEQYRGRHVPNFDWATETYPVFTWRDVDAIDAALGTMRATSAAPTEWETQLASLRERIAASLPAR